MFSNTLYLIQYSCIIISTCGSSCISSKSHVPNGLLLDSATLSVLICCANYLFCFGVKKFIELVILFLLRNLQVKHSGSGGLGFHLLIQFVFITRILSYQIYVHKVICNSLLLSFVIW